MKIAAIADLHCRANSAGAIRGLLEGVERDAQVLILAGDLTDTGLPAEMETLLHELAGFTRPIVAVLGNHDHESDQAGQLAAMLRGAGVNLLDGSVCEIGGVGFVGTKGFCGGFDGGLVQPFGERALKTFIQAGIDEAVRLESALAKLDCPHRVGVLHYAPIEATLAGEPQALYAFLGSSRLANALDRRRVDVIVHGHAHHGSPEGHTAGGTPVYNVSRFVQTRYTQRPYCLLSVGE